MFLSRIVAHQIRRADFSIMQISVYSNRKAANMFQLGLNRNKLHSKRNLYLSVCVVLCEFFLEGIYGRNQIQSILQIEFSKFIYQKLSIANYSLKLKETIVRKLNCRAFTSI